MERAARIKKRWLQLDSLGPVIDGVALRESVAFSTSKDLLIGDSDELASVGVISSPAISLDVDGILLPLIGEQLSNTSETFPKYSLFTTNCRWFSRRLLLNIAQTLSASHLPHEFKWRSKHCRLQHLSSKLEHELFGGQHLGHRKGDLLRAQILTMTGRSLTFRLRPRQALEFLTESLALLNTVKLTDEEQHFIAYNLHSQSIALTMLGLYEEALPLQKRAVAIFRDVRSESRLYHQEDGISAVVVGLYGLSGILSKLNRYEEAVEIHEEIVPQVRVLWEEQVGIYEQKLGIYLRTYALDLARLTAPRFEDAIVAGLEALSHLLLGAALIPDSTSQMSLVRGFESYYLIHYYMGEPAEALDVLKDAIRTSKDLFLMHPESFRFEHCQMLQHLARYYFETARQPANALPVLEEVLGHNRVLYKEDPMTYGDSLRRTLDMLGDTHRQLGSMSIANEVSAEGAIIARKLYQLSPKQYRHPLIITLFNRAHLMCDLHHPDAEAEILCEITEIAREAYAHNPVREAYQYATVLSQYSLVLQRQERWEASVEILSEAIRILKAYIREQPQSSLVSFSKSSLAAALCRLATSLTSKRLKEPQTALEMVMEAEVLLRSLFASNPQVYRSELGASLNQHVDILLLLGRHDDVEVIKNQRDALLSIEA